MKFFYIGFWFLFLFIEFVSFLLLHSSTSFDFKAFRQWNKLISIPFSIQVSASDPDCGVNAMVNYTLGDGFKKMTEFEVKHITGDICISGNLDFETRSSYEFPVIATDQGNCWLSMLRQSDEKNNKQTQNITNR